MTTRMERDLEEKMNFKRLLGQSKRRDAARKLFPDLRDNPFVGIPPSCSWPWWLGGGHKRHFVGDLTWVCLRCGVVVRIDVKDTPDSIVHAEVVGYTNPNKGLPEDET